MLCGSQEEQALLNFNISNVEYACGCSLDNASALNWDQNEEYPQFTGDDVLVQDGITNVLSRLASGVDLSLNTVVGGNHNFSRHKLSLV